jgi:hypothetical protein
VCIKFNEFIEELAYFELEKCTYFNALKEPSKSTIIRPMFMVFLIG